MLVRTSLIGAVATIAMALAPAVHGASPPDAFERSVKANLEDSHDRGGVPAATNTMSDAFERHVEPTRGGVQPLTSLNDVHDRQPAPQRPVTVAGSSGFDWSDAAIGALSGMGLGLLFGGAALLMLGLRTRTRVATD